VRRRGRERMRQRDGRLIHPHESPAAIAATMPHRRALGEKAVDQLAESGFASGGAAWRARAGAGDRQGGDTSRAFVLPEPL